MYWDEELVIAVLKALEQVGDESSIRHVERLARIRPVAQNQQRIQEAAQQCLSALLQSVESRSPGSTLLRASEGSSTEALLRPARSEPGAESENLLRPAEPDMDKDKANELNGP
jgi:hypothetical protein